MIPQAVCHLATWHVFVLFFGLAVMARRVSDCVRRRKVFLCHDVIDKSTLVQGHAAVKLHLSSFSTCYHRENELVISFTYKYMH